jgi:hypothetical protein
MALFWVFAELFIIIYIKKGISSIIQDGKKHHAFIVFACVFFMLLFFATFFRQYFYQLFPNPPGAMQKKFYGYSLWHFYCSQWVVFEAGITFYILRVYALMRQSVCRSNRLVEKWRIIERFAIFGVSAFLFLYASLFIGYEFLTFSALRTDRINQEQLYHIYLFYIKICGIFWIAIDGGAAFLGYKIFRFLKNHQPPTTGSFSEIKIGETR